MKDPLFWLYADNFRTINIDVARKLKSLNAAFLLAELASRHRYHLERNELNEDGLFYYTSEAVEERTYLSRKNQDTAISILVKAGLIEKKIIGLPARRYFRLIEENIQAFFFGEDSSNEDKPDEPDESEEAKVGKKESVQPRLTETDKLESSLSERGKLACPKRTNCTDRKGQTAHIIYKPKEEPKKEEETHPYPCKHGDSAGAESVGDKLTPRQKGTNPRAKGTNPRARKKEGLISFGSHVKLTQQEHQELIAKNGSTMIETLIEEMNDYCAASKPKGYSDYAAALRQWIRKREGTGVQPKRERKFAPCSDDNRAREAFAEMRKRAL